MGVCIHVTRVSPFCIIGKPVFQITAEGLSKMPKAIPVICRYMLRLDVHGNLRRLAPTLSLTAHRGHLRPNETKVGNVAEVAYLQSAVK